MRGLDEFASDNLVNLLQVGEGAEVQCDVGTYTNEDSLIEFSFEEIDEIIAPGISHSDPVQINEDDRNENFAVTLQPYGGNYYDTGVYNQKDYKIVQGRIVASNGFNFSAYTIHPSATPATAYVAVKNFIAYKFPEKVDWEISTFDGSTFS